MSKCAYPVIEKAIMKNNFRDEAIQIAGNLKVLMIE